MANVYLARPISYDGQAGNTSGRNGRLLSLLLEGGLQRDDLGMASSFTLQTPAKDSAYLVLDFVLFCLEFFYLPFHPLSVE
jgi:hypothetical protein